MGQGKSLLELRRCLVNRDWANLDSKLSAALSAQADGPETNLAKVYLFVLPLLFFFSSFFFFFEI